MNFKQCEAPGKSDHNHFGKPSFNEDSLEFHVPCISIIVKKMNLIYFSIQQFYKYTKKAYFF